MVPLGPGPGALDSQGPLGGTGLRGHRQFTKMKYVQVNQMSVFTAVVLSGFELLKRAPGAPQGPPMLEVPSGDLSVWAL